MSPDEIILKWNNFQSHISTTFENILKQKAYSDVTLVCDDGPQLLAHKLVLSACSPVLGSILHNNPHPHPLLYMKGVKQQQMKAVLQYMYLWEVSVNQDRIQEFLDLAKEFQMKELNEGYSDTKEVWVSMETLCKDEAPEIGDDQLQRETNNITQDQNSFKSLDVENSKFSSDPFTEILQQNVKCNDCSSTFATNRNLLRHRQSKHDSIRYLCDQCEYQATRPELLTNHQKTKHEGLIYTCNMCEYFATRSESLKSHKESKHGTPRYSCKQCDYQTMESEDLKIHKASQHEKIKYPCNECNYQATEKGILKFHKESKHEGIRYFCDECDFQAIRPSHIKPHKQDKHEGIRYPCSQCDYKATRQTHLRIHKLSKHEGVTYSCSKCEFSAKWMIDLNKHKQSIHNQ